MQSEEDTSHIRVVGYYARDPKNKEKPEYDQWFDFRLREIPEVGTNIFDKSKHTTKEELKKMFEEWKTAFDW